MTPPNSSQSIRRLPPHVTAQIKSSVTITSLNTVVVELVKNALDASAKTIEIHVDYARRACVVKDDGLGIPAGDFKEDGGLAKLYYSSKTESTSTYHGSRGIFLSALTALSMVSILSKHHMHHSQNSITFNHSRVLARHLPSLQRNGLTSRHGTRVTVRDLFGNMPVRVKHRTLEAMTMTGNKRDWEALKRAIIGLVLAWHEKVAVAMEISACSFKMVINPGKAFHGPEQRMLSEHVCTILSQAYLISLSERSSWVPINASTSRISMTGVISLDPMPTKDIQFISLGVQSLDAVAGYKILYDEINKCFSNSSFGVEEYLDEKNTAKKLQRKEDHKYKRDSPSGKELRGLGKAVDRWPMFYFSLNVKHSSSTLSIAEYEISSGKRGDILASIVELLQVTVREFLMSNHFRPRQSSKRKSSSLASSARPEIAGKLSNIILSQGNISEDKHLPAVCAIRRRSRTVPSTEDFLGAGIKIPPFTQRGSNKHELMVEQWSKIKCGNPRPSLCQDIQHGEHTQSSHLARSKLAPRVPANAPASSKAGPRTAVVFKAGRITQPPVDNFLNTRRQIVCPGELFDTAKNEAILWINPVTKERSFLNARTGFTIREDGPKGERMNTLPLPGIHRHSLEFSRPASASSIPAVNEQSSAWIRGLLYDWENPVFCPTEQAIPQASAERYGGTVQTLLHEHRHNCSQLDIDRVFTSVAAISRKISKHSLKVVEVISQIDKKFILISVAIDNSKVLVIVDQHAADERCRVEALLRELCSPPIALGYMPIFGVQVGVRSTRLERSLIFNLPVREVQLLETHAQHLADWGIVYTLPKKVYASEATSELQVIVTHLPPVIVERCKLEPRLLIELIRSDVWEREQNHNWESANQLGLNDDGSTGEDVLAWLTRIHDCPQGILDMLNSRACRSAIMFNDELTVEQCRALISRLADCVFPFQCAHGRPSMVPLVDVGMLEPEDGIMRTGSEFALAFSAWKLSH